MAGYGNKHDGLKVTPFDWKNIEKDGPKPPATGYYELEVVKATFKPTKDNEPMVALQLAPRKLITSEDVVDVKAGNVWENAVFTPGAAWKAKQFCEAAGIRPPAVNKKATQETFEDWADEEAVGASVMAFVTLGKDLNGRPQARIQQFLTPDELTEAIEESKSLADDGEDEDEDEKPRRKSKAAAASDAETPRNGKGRNRAEDGDEDEDEEPPARRMGRRAAVAEA